jgi:hypothetical protein
MIEPERPRVTINTLVDYLSAGGPRQRFAVLKNAKQNLGRRAFAPYYQAARQAIRRFHSGDAQMLNSEIQRLRRELRDLPPPIEPRDKVRRAKVENNLRVIADYRDSFGDVEFEYARQQFEAIMVNAVRVSTEPTLSGRLVRRRATIEANVIVECHEEEPTDDELEFTAELISRLSAQSHPTPVSGSQVWHPASGTVYSLTRQSSRRWDDIRQACREIVLQWPTVQ